MTDSNRKVNLNYSITKRGEYDLYILADAETFEPIIENVMVAFRIIQINKQWNSRCNKYVSFNYKPFALSGFDVEYNITLRTEQHRNYLLYELQKKFERLVNLEKQYQLEYSK